MHYLLFYDDLADRYVERREPYRRAHYELLKEFHARGELVLAGTLDDPVNGAVLVFSGNHPDAAERFIARDPYAKNGLVKKWHVRKWSTVIGEGSTPPIFT